MPEIRDPSHRYRRASRPSYAPPPDILLHATGRTAASSKFWAAAHGALLLAQRHPDGDGFEMFRPFDTTNSTAALLDALRLYLVSGATK